MCHFIAAVVPASADLRVLSEVAIRNGRRLEQLHRPAIQAQLGFGEVYLRTTVGPCDCGTSLGSARRESAATPPPRDHLGRLKKRGWSDTKIRRWLEQQEQADAKRAAKVPEACTASWRTFLDEGLAPKDVRYIGLLLHFGDLSEPIQLARRQVVALSQADAAFLSMIEEDVLYEFRRSA
jgi:hypothetical protein